MKKVRIFLLLIGFLLLAACSSQGNQNNASAAIEAYLQALVSKDANQLANHSCAAWEEQAQQELRSFAAESAKLEQLQCQEDGIQENATRVKCTGKIIASYGAEDLVIELSDRIFTAVQEGGEWRMCGYSQ